MSNQTIYVELDALMDTRIACIEQLYGLEVVQEILKSEYEQRDNDDWSTLSPSLDTQEINSLYQRHELTTLAGAVMSNLIKVLRDFVTQANKGSAGNPLADPVAIHINIAPYHLPEKHCQVIANSVSHHLGIIDVKTINVPKYLTTPAFFQGAYKTVFMYNFIDWFTMHHKAMHTQGMAEMVWYVPRLKAFGFAAQDMEASLDETASMIYKKMSVWDAATIALTGYMNLQFLDVDAFNIYA